MYGKKIKESDLASEPHSSVPFGSSADWHTYPRIHGNVLYLLNALIQDGLARFKNSQTKPSPYQALRKLCSQQRLIWGQGPEREIESLFDQLEFANQAHIRIIGGVLPIGDQDEGLILRFIQKIKQNNQVNLEIILSERDMNIFLHDSKHGLDVHPDLGAPFFSSLRLLSHDRGSQGNLIIYSHAPISEFDIVEAANSLLSHPWLSDQDRKTIYSADYNVSSHDDSVLTNEDLEGLIDILNRFVQNRAEQGKLFELPRCHPPLFITHWGQKVADLKPNYALKKIYSNDQDPNEIRRRKGHRSRCKFVNVTSGTDKSFENCIHLGEPFSRHVSRSHHTPYEPPPPRNWAPICAAAVLFVGLATLIVVRICTGDLSAFFALGALRMMGQNIMGLPHLGVLAASVATYFYARPKRSDQEDNTFNFIDCFGPRRAVLD